MINPQGLWDSILFLMTVDNAIKYLKRDYDISALWLCSHFLLLFSSGALTCIRFVELYSVTLL